VGNSGAIEPIKGSVASQVIATGAIAILSISRTISLAALIFAGPLNAALPTALGAFILSGAIASIVIGQKSSFQGIFSGVQDTSGVVVATVVASAAVGLSGETQVLTALVIVAISTLVIGVVFTLLGRFRLGSMVRYLPQPVVGGFVAGTGWLMFRGGVEVMANRTITPGTLVDAFGWNQSQMILPGLALAIFIVVAVARSFRPISISLSVVFAAVAFYVGVALLSSVSAAEAGGWLIGPFDSSAQWSPFTPSELAAVDWGVVVSQVPAFAAIALIAIVGMLLNLTALEAVSGEDIDFDHELKVAGVVNVITGGVGGGASWHLIGATTLARHLQVRTRLVPIAVGILGIVVMLVGSRIIGLVPRAVAGGVLGGLGLSLLWTWVADYVVPSVRSDRLLGFGILLAIILFGPLIGIALGVAVAAGLFVVQYSRINPVRHLLSGKVIRSTVDRAPHEQALLESGTAATQVVILDGYLFFGSATKVARSIDEQVAAVRSMPLRSLIIDLERVIGMDVSAASALASRVDRVVADDIAVTFSGANEAVSGALSSRDIDERVTWAETLDHAIEMNENGLLADVAAPPGAPFTELLNEELNGGAETFLKYCERFDVARGEYLIRAGESADSLYFIEDGELVVMAPGANGSTRRLRKTGAGAVLGEIAFATTGVRTADVIAESDVVVRELTREALKALQADDPALANEFQAFLTRMVAVKLRERVKAIDEILR